VRGRRVLENASEKKRGLDPLRSQIRHWGKLIDENRNADELRTRGMIEVTRSNERYGARVVDTIRIRVDSLVQLR
jgi:hypothetical protein